MGCTNIADHDLLSVFLRGRSRTNSAKGDAMDDCNVDIDDSSDNRDS